MAEKKPNEQQKLVFKNIRLFRNDILGRGSYGFVCKAQCDQLTCAAKIIYDALREAVAPDPGREHRQPYRRFESEIDFLKHVHHPNIVQYLGTYEDLDSGDLVLLMELMDESLTHFLESSPKEIPYHTQVNLSYDIAQALAFLHANGIIHRDLSSNNVLLLAGIRAKVTDFGMSKFIERNALMTLCPGTPAFMSPEALNEPPVYTEKLDNFSFGVLLVQIVTRKFPEPSSRFTKRELVDLESKKIYAAHTNVPEVERRNGHISLIQQDHPLLPIALDCLEDQEQDRPFSLGLCRRLNALKRSDEYKVSSQRNSAHLIKELQAQHQAEIEAKTSENNQLAARLKQATSELASGERQLRSLKEQLTDNEQITATPQQEPSKFKEVLPTDYETVRVQQLGNIIKWDSQTTLPIRITPGSSATIGDTVYLKPAGTKLIIAFNSSTQQWSVISDHPIDRFTLVNVKNTLKTVGGENEELVSNRLYSYLNGQWIETLPPMPTKRHMPGAVYTNNRLIVAGGYDGKHLSTVEILNTTSRQWSSASSLPFTTSVPSICVHGDHIYVQAQYTVNVSERYSFLGCSLTALTESKPNSRVWERLTPLEVQHSTLTSVNSHLIAVGGINSNRKPIEDIHQYNVTTDSWSVIGQMSVARYLFLTALLPGNKLMVVGGDGTERKFEIISITNN